MQLHILRKKAILPLLVFSFLLALCFPLMSPVPAQASGGPYETTWSMNANGYTGTMILSFARGGFNIGSVFGQWIQGTETRQADGTTRVDFILLGFRDEPFANYFQVYHGIRSIAGNTMSGTFNVYSGSRSGVPGTETFSYAMEPITYSWSATLTGYQDLHSIGQNYQTQYWSLTSQGNAELIAAADGRLSYGWAAGRPMIGVFPATGWGFITCYGCYPIYFIRTTSADWSTMEIYQGYASYDLMMGGGQVNGSFVEVSQGHSTGTQQNWSAYLIDIRSS